MIFRTASDRKVLFFYEYLFKTCLSIQDHCLSAENDHSAHSIHQADVGSKFCSRYCPIDICWISPPSSFCGCWEYAHSNRSEILPRSTKNHRFFLKTKKYRYFLFKKWEISLFSEPKLDILLE
jgi:hypothetical protein